MPDFSTSKPILVLYCTWAPKPRSDSQQGTPYVHPSKDAPTAGGFLRTPCTLHTKFIDTHLFDNSGQP